jgi:hypothetical protein
MTDTQSTKYLLLLNPSFIRPDPLISEWLSTHSVDVCSIHTADEAIYSYIGIYMRIY